MKFTTRLASTVVAQALTAVVGLVYSIVVAKALGPQLRGEFFVLQGYFAVAVQAATLSLHTAMTVQLSRGESEPGVVSLAAVLLSVALGLPAALLVFGVHYWAVGVASAPTWTLLLYFAVLPLALYKMLCGGILLGLHDIHRVNLLSVIDITVNTAAAVVAIVVLHLGLGGALLAVAFGHAAVAAWGYRQLPPPKARDGTWACMKDLLGLGIRQHTSFVTSQVYLRADAFILPAFVSPASIGQYAVARGLADRLQLAVAPVSQVMFPLIASAPEAESRLYTRVTVRLLFVLALVAATAFALLTPFVVPLLFGRAYAESIPLAQVLAVATAALAIQVPLNLWFVGSLKRPLLATVVTMVTLAAIVLPGPWMTAAFGARGMATTILLAFSVSSVAGLWLASRAGLPFRPVAGCSREYRAFWRSVHAGPAAAHAGAGLAPEAELR